MNEGEVAPKKLAEAATILLGYPVVCKISEEEMRFEIKWGKRNGL